MEKCIYKLLLDDLFENHLLVRLIKKKKSKYKKNQRKGELFNNFIYLKMFQLRFYVRYNDI